MHCHVIVPLTSFFMSCDRIVWSRATPLANARLMSPLHMVFLCFSTSFHNKSLVESPIPFVSIVYRPLVGRLVLKRRLWSLRANDVALVKTEKDCIKEM